MSANSAPSDSGSQATASTPSTTTQPSPPSADSKYSLERSPNGLEPSPPPPFTTLDLIDWKLAETKDGSSYITFLFEICFRYSDHFLAQAAARGTPLSPTVTLVVGKRFAELHAFHSLLEQHFVCLPYFPDKTLTRILEDKEFLSQRCQHLQSYLRQILIREDIQATGWFQKFMGIPSPASRLREACLKQAKLLIETERARTRAELEAEADERGNLHQPPAVPTVVKTKGQLAYESRYDSALEDGMAATSLADGVEVHAASQTNLSSLAHDEPSQNHEDQSHVEPAPEPEEEEDPSSEPATTSNSFIDTAPPASSLTTALPTPMPGDEYESDHEFDARLNKAESEEDRLKRKKEGSRVHNQLRKSLQPTNLVPHEFPSGSNSPSPDSQVPSVPSSVALEFITRSPVFHMLSFRIVDANTLLCASTDQSTVAKVDSWLSGLFGKKTPERDEALEENVTYTSSSSTSDLVNPLGALYAFRRHETDHPPQQANEEDFFQSLQIFFPFELSAMEWDSSRRWIYLTDMKGCLTIFNPSLDFDYAVKILTVPIFTNGPITHMKYFTIKEMPHGGLILASAKPSQPKQLLTCFDLQSQHLLHPSSFQFNVTSNSHGMVQALEIDPDTSRLFVSSSDRSITIYDLTTLTKLQPPNLLHRLANGHSGAIRCLAWNSKTQCLASGGEDKFIVLWKLGPKYHENLTQLYTRLPSHPTTIRSLAWQEGEEKEYLVSGDEDGHVCLWSPVRRACLMAFRAHSDAIVNLQLTATNTLVTASYDKASKLWLLS